LRSKFVLHCAPLVRDVVLTGLNRDELGALVFPDIAACRHLCSDLAADAPLQQVLSHPLLLARLQQHLDTLANTSTGSATRITRAYLMTEIPTVDTGEATDKGSLNCAAVLQRRAELVEQLYSDDSGTNPLQLRTT
jgi:feruloyl-CoA synthase